MSDLKIGFLCNSMCFLRYYIPIIKHINKKYGIECKLFTYPRDKYDEPIRHKNSLNELGQKYNFEVFWDNKVDQSINTFFTMEGEMADLVHGKYLASMTYQIDYEFSYPKYIDKVSNCFIQSRFLSEYYNAISDKNRFYTPSKYFCDDYDLNDIRNRLGCENKKVVCFIFPRMADLDRHFVEKVILKLKKFGYFVAVKTRGKDRIHFNIGDVIVEDDSWYPHSTLEILKVSDFAVNFDSTTIEECLLMDKKVLNFAHKKLENRGLNCLYDERFCIERRGNTISDQDVHDIINLNPDFESVKSDYYFAEHGGLKEMVEFVLSREFNQKLIDKKDFSV